MTTIKNFIDTLANTFTESVCTFNIYCDKHPTQLTQKRMGNSFRCRVLAVRIAEKIDDGKTQWFYPNTLQELGLEYVRVNESSHRIIRNKNKPFEIRGITETKTFKDFNYYDYDFATLSPHCIIQMEKIREMFNIETVDPYHGEHHEIVLPNINAEQIEKE